MHKIKFFVSISMIISCLFACGDRKSHLNEKNGIFLGDENESDSVVCEFSEEYSHETLPVSFCKHYSFGKLVRDGLFVNEQTPLSYHNFYDVSGKLKYIKEFSLFAKDSSVLNNIIAFSDDGDTLYSKSNFYKVKILNDTVFINQPIEIEVVLIPFFETSIAELAIKEVKNTDSVLISPLNNENNFRVKLELKPLKREGRYLIQGRIKETSRDPNDENLIRYLNVAHFFTVVDK